MIWTDGVWFGAQLLYVNQEEGQRGALLSN